MKQSIIYNTWQMENRELEKWEMIDNESIGQYLKPKIRKNNLTYYFNLYLYLLFLLAGIIILILNIPGYSANKSILYLISTLTVLSIIFTGYGIFLTFFFYRINKYDNDLVSLLKKQLRFISTYYEVWLAIIPFSILNLSFSFTLLMDNQNGDFPVSNKLHVIGIHALIYLVLYGLNKLANYFQKKPVLAYLDELMSEIQEENH